MAAGEYTTLALVKADLGFTDVDAARDAVIQTKVDATNAWMNEYLGLYVGPSVDTVRTYDIPFRRPAPDGYRVLTVPGGFRTPTLVEVATQTGGAFTTVPSSDWFARPLASQLPPNAPFTQLWISDLPSSGSVSAFYGGFLTARLTAAYGPATVPASLQEIGTTRAKRMWLSRQSGEGDIVGTSAFGTAIFSRFLSIDDKRTLDWWRYEVTSWGGI